MATRKISTRLAIEGESAYKQAIRDCNNEIKTMRSELTLVQSRYQTNANSVEALKAKYLAFGQALEAQKTEAENLEIVQMVRALRMTPAQLSAMLSGGTVPGSLADDNNEQEENSYEE